MGSFRCRAVVCGLSLVAVLAACGGSSASSGAPAEVVSSAPMSSAPAVTDASGGSSGASGTAPSSTPASAVAAMPPTGAPSRAVDPATVLPAVEVVDVSSGDKLQLASLVAADKPTLFWAWAPY